MGDFIPTPQLPGMKPWACEYIGQDGHRYGITLYGSDPEQVVNDNCDTLHDLKVLGESMGEIPIRDDDE